EKKPDFALALIERSLDYERQGDAERAEAELAKAGRIDPRVLVVGIMMSLMAEEKNGRFERALTACERIIRDHPQWIEPHLLRATIRSRMDDLEAARVDAEWMVSQHPDDLRGYLWRAKLCERRGDLEQAISDLDRVAGARPKRRAAFFLRG